MSHRPKREYTLNSFGKQVQQQIFKSVPTILTANEVPCINTVSSEKSGQYQTALAFILSGLVNWVVQERKIKAPDRHPEFISGSFT